MKNTWKGIKEILNLNNKKGPQITNLNYEGENIKTNKGMANAFNDYFTKVGADLDKEIPKNENLTFLLGSLIHF